MKRIPLSEVKDDLSRYLRDAETEEVIITRHGRPAGILIGFESEEDWFDYRLEHDPQFLKRIQAARDDLRVGRGVRLEDLDAGSANGREAPDKTGTPRKGGRAKPSGAAGSTGRTRG